MIVIPAGWTPEDWAAFGPQIMARLRAELELASFARGPEVIEPDQEPDDDTEAEVPDVREDTVPDDTP